MGFDRGSVASISERTSQVIVGEALDDVAVSPPINTAYVATQGANGVAVLDR